ncbi:PKD domain-containing protein [Acinetobacter nematophilus]|uniref:PKD domain-containing protein n=1 Tax=Acinetobacter nematophilus TaxID=2994642 RepID=UPI003AF86713
MKYLLFSILIGSLSLSGCGEGADSENTNNNGNNNAKGTTISGTILAPESSAEKPVSLAGGEVSFNLGSERYVAPVNQNGQFSLNFGGALQNAPTWVAGTYQKEGFVTQTIHIKVNGGTTSTVPLQINAVPLSDADVAVSSSYGAPSDLHHLGDNYYQGSVNSQLQISSQGLTWGAVVAGVDKSLLYKYPAGICVTLDIRGVNAGNHDLVIFEDEAIELSPSPSDGSFGRQTHCFTKKPATHISGSLLKIESHHDGSGDYDDFEFINVKVHFSQAQPSLPITISGSQNVEVGYGGVYKLSNVWMNNIAQVVWQFGDGTPEQTIENSFEVIHSYKTPGDKTITAIYKDKKGEVLGQVTQTIKIEPLAAPNSSYVYVEKLSNGAIRVYAIADRVNANVRVIWPDGSIGEAKNVSPPDQWSITSKSTKLEYLKPIKIQHFVGDTGGEFITKYVP